MKIKAFHAWRPDPTIADKVAAPPYDVVDTEEARALSAGNPVSFLHINRAEIDLPPQTDLYDDAVYRQAALNFQLFKDKGWLKREATPCLYLYRITMGEHRQTGLVTVCHVDDYEQNVIKKHEKTRQAPEDDRTRYTHTVNANLGPVFLAYRPRPEIDAWVAAAVNQTPLFDFVAFDGTRQEIWKVAVPEQLIELFRRVPEAYIADGHHRAASAARVGRERKRQNPNHTGAEEYNWFLAVLFPANQLRIMPYNRVVKDLNGYTPAAFVEALKKAGITVCAPDRAAPLSAGTASMYLNGTWMRLAWAPPAGDPVAALDVSVLQNKVLGPLLGIDDPRTNKRIEFVGGIRGTDELSRRVDSGRAAVAFSMYPTTMDQLMAISDAGQVMPPKSTWFEPKLKSGLLVHDLE